MDFFPERGISKKDYFLTIKEIAKELMLENEFLTENEALELAEIIYKEIEKTLKKNKKEKKDWFWFFNLIYKLSQKL